MSAEGKKKRGEAGHSNAKTIPFRYNGCGCWPKSLRATMGTLAGMIGRPPGKDGYTYGNPR